jgi:hypothetical protein
VEEIEKKGITEGKLVKAYKKYRNLRELAKPTIRRPFLRVSEAMKGIYLLSILVWAWWWGCGLGIVTLFIIGVLYLQQMRESQSH